jgi:hypothetical protein
MPRAPRDVRLHAPPLGIASQKTLGEVLIERRSPSAIPQPVEHEPKVGPTARRSSELSTGPAQCSTSWN